MSQAIYSNQTAAGYSYSQSPYRTTAILLIVEALLIFAPLTILGAAINWPASLGEPARVMLPLIHQQATAVQLGYFSYLVYSILFWPVALMTTRTVAGSDMLNPMLRLAVGFGLASMLARTLGIIRWLVPMPMLASLYVDPATTESTREMIGLIYQMLNVYAGSIGEVLGVSLLAGLWLVLVAITMLRSAHFPGWLGLFGLIAAVAQLSALIELFGIDLGAFITVTVSILHFWFLATGVVLWFHRSN